MARFATIKLDVKKLDNIADDLARTGIKSVGIAKQGHYEGMGVIANEYANRIKSIPTEQEYSPQYGRQMSPYIPVKQKALKGLPEYMKNDLLKGMITSKIKYSGTETSSSVSFIGFGSVPTKKYPNGVPNALLMRAINKGTHNQKGFERTGLPITDRTRNASRPKAKVAVKNKIYEELKKELKHGN